MIKVVGVKFKSTGKTYYFDPGCIDVEQGDMVIVETARGLEFGNVCLGITEVKNEDVVKPLKKVVRIANDNDIKKHQEHEAKKADAMAKCQELVEKHKLEMKLVDVEFTFDSCKIIFYFTAEGRIDFRELVKDLAAAFRMRIELRQVGARDEAKMLGGVGNCGKGLCCATWLSDFQPVSIKMAKTQNLSLNPAKISGICGRLMCCLKYENDLYTEMRKGMPDNGEKVKTPSGMGKVFDTNILEGKVRVRLMTGEKEDNGADKLDSEILVFDKSEIRRTKGQKKPNDTQQEEMTEEIKKLMQD
ncbi:MAG: stage 0 sporulation family protein [Peptostreptococcaceae bacterium]|nr:stage 0 sporulation family protein [Peptostreptococcaceae bacterium]SFD98987.1 Cell fate regulator YaaT, PSP1 superfamily (controls sporulation, competence, biofilm development) [Peptostreptococcaceae bacterium pGA-8]